MITNGIIDLSTCTVLGEMLEGFSTAVVNTSIHDKNIAVNWHAKTEVFTWKFTDAILTLAAVRVADKGSALIGGMLTNDMELKFLGVNADLSVQFLTIPYSLMSLVAPELAEAAPGTLGSMRSRKLRSTVTGIVNRLTHELQFNDVLDGASKPVVDADGAVLYSAGVNMQQFLLKNQAVLSLNGYSYILP